ncbi:MAG: N-acetylmuramoyl-L-alanine amidase [Mariniphaga sp.]|nr:N-acetylmuramoyl-L-alanine amidase [Mariniphaga sp.]
MNNRKQYILILFLLTGYFITGNAAEPPNQQVPGSSIRTIVIDPGHGGKDPGAVYGKAREKEIVLDIALKLGNYIKNAFPEVNVIYTRNRDVFVPLFQRAAIANKNDADLFISIHVNAVERGMVQGTETYILGQHRTKDNLEVAKKENSVILLEDDYHITYEGFDPNSPESYIMFELVQDEYLEQSVMLASAVQDQFRERAKRIDRSVKQAGFLVLRQTTMPGILVETGFINHPAEREFLMSESGRDYLASAIFRAFKDYKKKVEARSSFNMVTESISDESLSSSNNNSHKNKNLSQPTENNIFFSVQIASLSNPVEINATNFKGESEIFMQNQGQVYRYFSGRFKSVQHARKEQKRLQNKFNGAFVVAFVNNELVSVQTATQNL